MTDLTPVCIMRSVCECVRLGTRSSRSTNPARDAQVSPADSLPHLSPRTICSLHTRRRPCNSQASWVEWWAPGALTLCKEVGDITTRVNSFIKEIYECLHFTKPENVQVEEDKKSSRAIGSVISPGHVRLLTRCTLKGDKNVPWTWSEDKDLAGGQLSEPRELLRCCHIQL